MTLRLHELTYGYRGAATPALDRITHEFAGGSTTAVLGVSGSGKTTLLNLLGLLGDVRPPRGAVRYDSPDGMCDYHELPPWRRVRFRRDYFGFVLQSAYLLPHFSCRDNVAVPLALRGETARARRRRVDALLERADPSGGLFALRDRSPRDISGGERQRLAVLRAVVHDPHVLFADEPFSNLDPHNTRQILSLLEAWRDGKLHPEPAATPRPRMLILVSHALRTAVEFAGGRYVVLRRGCVAAAGLLSPEGRDAGLLELERRMLGAGEGA